MSRIQFTKAVPLIFALCSVFAGSPHTWTQEAKTQYPKMAPLDQYLMADRNAEIALARSAAPESISGDAEVLVLGRQGYETAVRVKTVSCVSWSDRGWLPLTTRSF